MKIALLNDTHFGARNDSPAFLEYFMRFYNEIFFPYIKENNIKTYAGGGSTIEAINKFDHKSSFEHVSSGGGAFLELLEKETLPGIENLYEAR